ncbi:hypothetical protein PGT21_031633 [Puccinia graminis f. sp. tritici]|uniref:Uncharacterized protein n=1 Tax=Puccinia graminis f. sp. tritici TaxID=56615 RepID=A0A5B0QJX1_PUCGR|nr:hypothetical protein PGT21_031633 [Puccinia graminis f. sp. tritici]
MSGKVKMPKSEHIHSESYVQKSEISKKLCHFPTNQQIDDLLSIAQKRADVLISFAGMQKIPGVTIGEISDLSDSDITSTPDDVSSSTTKAYYYKPNATSIDDPSDNINNAMQDAAVVASERQELENNLLECEATHEMLENELVQTSRISIQNLLNALSSTNTLTSSEKPGNQEFEDQSSLDLVKDNKLNQENLVCLRHNHDSEIQVHHGNERRKRRSNTQPSSEEPPAPAKLDPKICSKIVSICLKDADAQQNTMARMHQWNIPIQLNLKTLSKHTSVNLDFSAHNLFATGQVDKENPLEPGKFAAVITKGASYFSTFFKNGRHEYTKASDTRAKLSYIHVQLFNYSSTSPIALGYNLSTPDRYTFALINTHDLHFLFRETEGMTITQMDPSEACVWVPSPLRVLLQAMSSSAYIKKVEADVAPCVPKSKK